MACPGAVAEWLGRGLQSLVQRFESARRLAMGLFDRWRRRRTAAGDAWSEEDIPSFLEAMQPISVTEALPAAGALADFRAACFGHSDLAAVFVFDSDFGGAGDRLVTIGLVVDQDSDLERFSGISKDLEHQIARLFADDFIFQRLDAYSLDRIDDGMSPIYERPE